VNTVAVCRLLSIVFINSIASRALIMASCSAWLLEHLLSNCKFYLSWDFLSYENYCAGSNTFLAPIFVYLYSLVLVVFSLNDCNSINWVWLPLFFLMYCLTASSVLIIIGVVPVRMQSASLDVVRNALAIHMFISRCTLIYFCLLCSYFMASIQTGAPYSRRGKMAPLYMVFIHTYIIS